MVYTSQTGQSAAAAAASAAGTEKSETADAALFAQELGSRMAGSAAASRLEQSIARLEAAFPGMKVSSQSLSGFSQAASFFGKVNADASVNIDPQILEEMADDDTLFDRVKEMLSGLFAAGSQQTLVGSGGQNVQRHVTVSSLEVRYVEVQRTSAGAQLSAGSLAFSMLSGSFSSSVDDLLDLIRNAGSGLSGTIFENLLQATNAWWFQVLLSALGFGQMQNMSGSAGMNGLMQSQMTYTRVEIVIEQWQAEGGTVDLWTYMQIAGLTDPLVFDLGDEGINLRSAEDGVYFDINGDGTPSQTAFIQGNNAFLYLDQNGNGVADDISELFGDFGGFANGFEMLAQYDENGDGVIDENDAIYHQLRLWRDLNGDGINQIEESMTLAEAGIKSINLRYNDHLEMDQYGNVIGEKSTFTREDGSTGLVADVWLRSLK